MQKIPVRLSKILSFSIESCYLGGYISGLEKKENDRPPARGWAGKNPQTYHSLTAVTNYAFTLGGVVVFGHYLADYLEKPWIEWVAIVWGVFVNLFFLMHRLKMIDEKYGKKKEDDKQK